MIFGLSDKILAMVGGGASIVLAGGLIWQTIQVSNLTDQIEDPETGYQVRLETAQRNLGACQGNQVRLEGDIRSQNAKIEELETESARRTANLERSLQISQRDLRSAEQRAQSILEAQPDPDGDICAQALDLIRGEAP